MISTNVKRAIGILIFSWISFVAVGQKAVVIELKTAFDTVDVGFWGGESEKRHEWFYAYENPADSVYLKLHFGCGREGMDPTIKCHASYRFVDGIADGIYQLKIDGQHWESVSFMNGLEHGLKWLSYLQSGTAFKVGEKYCFVENYANGRKIEEYVVDRMGNVMKYRPKVKNSAGLTRNGLEYHFDRKGQLISIGYDLGIYIQDSFSKNGTYVKTELPAEDKRYLGKPSERYAYSLTRIQRKGMAQGEQPNGWVEIQLKGTDVICRLHFRDGVLLGWQRTTDDHVEAIRYDVPSSEIGIKRLDLKAFIPQ